MSFWAPDTIAAACAGEWVTPPTRGLAGASIDTREIEAGQLFFALRGERVDGHAFVRDAAGRDAGAAVVEDVGAVGDVPGGLGLLRVEDVRTALRDLAAAYRVAHPELAVVGVTGSNGKTTTVRLIHAALAGARRGSCSRKSFNNELGLPLTLLNAGEREEYVVCEMGASTPGEIARLAAIARPDVGVVTSIGRAHMEGLGSIAGVAREKGSLILSLGADALGVIPDDSPELDQLVGAARSPIARIGVSDQADARLSNTRSDSAGVSFELEGFGQLRTGLLGAHNARNAAMAALVARHLGADDASIRAGLAGAGAVEMRLAVERIETPRGAITLLDDTYNANPDSMRAALATLAAFQPGAGGRRVAVLADMLELGDASAGEHESLLGSLPHEIDAAHALGPAMAAAGGTLADPRIRPAPRIDGASIAAIVDDLRPGDVVLLKASRGMRLERVADAIRAAAAVHSPQPTDGG